MSEELPQDPVFGTAGMEAAPEHAAADAPAATAEDAAPEQAADRPEPAEQAEAVAADSACEPTSPGAENATAAAAAEEATAADNAPVAHEPQPPVDEPAAAAAAAEGSQEQQDNTAEQQVAKEEQEDEKEHHHQQSQQSQQSVEEKPHLPPPQHSPAHAAAPAQHTTHHVSAAAAAGRLQATKPCGATGSVKGLTFSKPPYTVKAKPYKRVDYSHSAVELLKIGHDNQLLVRHLTTISKAVPSWRKEADAPPAPGNTASSAVNRRKHATVIAQENHALYQRLVGIRPSKDISRDTLEFEHRQHEAYRANCAQFKPKAVATTTSPRKAAGAAAQ